MAKRPAKKAAKKTTAKETIWGRPPLHIDWEQVDSLAALHCNAEEIATVLKMSTDTLYKRCKKQYGCTLAEYLKTKRNAGRASLRRMMFKNAQSGNVAMQIFIAKNWLGMSDKPEPEEGPSVAKRLVLSIENVDHVTVGNEEESDDE